MLIERVYTHEQGQEKKTAALADDFLTKF